LPVKNLFAHVTLSYVSSLYVYTFISLKVILILGHGTYHKKQKWKSNGKYFIYCYLKKNLSQIEFWCKLLYFPTPHFKSLYSCKNVQLYCN